MISEKHLADLFRERFGELPEGRVVLASAPGRLELAGNHTDHQGGCVIAAGLDQRIYALAVPNGTDLVRADMDGYGHEELDLAAPDVLAPREAEKGTSVSLIRGMIAEYVQSGGEVRGFDMVTASDLPIGAGVSSSAAFETLVGAVLRGLTAYDYAASGDDLTFSDAGRRELALQGMRVEHRFFGKSCGAQDQIASAFGGIVFMDFADEDFAVEPLAFDFWRTGYRILLIDSGVDHSRYPEDFERVAGDMFAVARACGAERLEDVDLEAFAAREDALRAELGEVPMSRAKHYFGETARVRVQRDALLDGDFARFLNLVKDSGRSSATLLRNIVPSAPDPDDDCADMVQRILDACARELAKDGAWRIHGGGFGGSVLAIVPEGQIRAFTDALEALAGEGACREVEVAERGVTVRFADASEFPQTAPLEQALPSVQVEQTASAAQTAQLDEGRIYWTGETRFGMLEVSINLRKPEKDPRAIAAAAANPGQAPCDLCRENDDFDSTREQMHDPRIGDPEFPMSGEPWRVHFSPYGYYENHCIVMTIDHHPMKIDRGCLERLIQCTERFPFYFMGSNADLPIVGGSILAHDHFQGGGHVFPLMRAPIERAVVLPEHPAVTCGIVRWPASTLRLESYDSAAIVDAAATILDAWQGFDCPACGILHATGSELHSTITPIAYRASFIAGGQPEQSAQPAQSEFGNSYVLDLVLRNNRTTPECPYGLFHPDESLHHIKKENIGLIEIMGLAILPARLATEIPGIDHDSSAQAEVTDAFVQILESTAVFKDDNAGREGWLQFIRSIHGEII